MGFSYTAIGNLTNLISSRKDQVNDCVRLHLHASGRNDKPQEEWRQQKCISLRAVL